jgi:NADP-dependent 3-hydroxy acid dehydrogenase YdfG
MADALRAEEPELRMTTIYPRRVATEMQQALRAQEQAAYEPERHLRPETVAQAIAFVLATPRDAVVTDLLLKPSHP